MAADVLLWQVKAGKVSPEIRRRTVYRILRQRFSEPHCLGGGGIPHAVGIWGNICRGEKEEKFNT
jgi:hypothetical protein